MNEDPNPQQVAQVVAWFNTYYGDPCNVREFARRDYLRNLRHGLKLHDIEAGEQNVSRLSNALQAAGVVRQIVIGSRGGAGFRVTYKNPESL